MNASVPAIIPQPNSIRARDDAFVLDARTRVVASGEARATAELAASELRAATGLPLPVTSSGRGIVFRLDARLSGPLGPEGYRLRVAETGIEIVGAKPAGLFYGYQTLKQLMAPDVYRKAAIERAWTVPGVEIEDRPRFGWRGAMLDVGRYWLPKEFLFRFVDQLALHKLNTFHLHLTEDQGWRIEIKRYPKLTAVGSFRPRSMLVYPNKWDDRPHSGYYTQDDLKELVAYAQARHVTIVPEIEMPGHAQAAIAAYPELGNLDRPLEVSTTWGVHENVFNVEESTIQFLKNVLEEVLAIFPSKFIHIGGDEVPKRQWKESPRAQQLMRERGLKNEEELQSWFIKQIDSFLDAKGRRLVGWDEILEGGLAEGATLMDWRGYGAGATAARQGHDVVIAWTSHTYLDYYQSQFRSLEPHQIGGYLPLSRVYSLDPIPDGLSAKEQQRILGTQGQIWGEYAPDARRAEYLAYPRLSALAEVAWSRKEDKDYAGFLARLPKHLERLDVLGVAYRKAAPDPAPIARWQASQITMQGSDLSWEATSAFPAPGRYRIGFFWTGGKHGVDISNVRLEIDGQPLAASMQTGFAGASSRQNEFVLDVPRTGSAVLRATLKGSEGTDSAGDIVIIPDARPSW